MKKHSMRVFRDGIGAALALSFAATSAHSGEYEVVITNLTSSIYFTPVLVTAHDASTHLFQVGENASSSLQAMAEGGDLAGLLTDLGGEDADTVSNPAAGLLGPGQSTTANLSTDTGYLSIVTMMLPTNDGFVGADSLSLPATGTTTHYLNGYDAGTEPNDELMNPGAGGVPGTPGIPGDPTGSAGAGGTGVSASDPHSHVHVHRGALGDTSASGGASDLDSRVHRWLNPVAKVRITAQ